MAFYLSNSTSDEAVVASMRASLHPFLRVCSNERALSDYESQISYARNVPYQRKLPDL